MRMKILVLVAELVDASDFYYLSHTFGNYVWDGVKFGELCKMTTPS